MITSRIITPHCYLTLSMWRHGALSPLTKPLLGPLENNCGVWTYFDDLSVFQVGLLSLQNSSAFGLITEEGSHGLLRSILVLNDALLALALVLSDGGSSAFFVFYKWLDVSAPERQG